jgi:hypothetical protein
MPYANPEDRRASQRAWKKAKYQTDPEFREIEAERKARWLQTWNGKRSNRASSRRWLDAQKSSSPSEPKASTQKAATAKTTSNQHKTVIAQAGDSRSTNSPRLAHFSMPAPPPRKLRRA